MAPEQRKMEGSCKIISSTSILTAKSRILSWAYALVSSIIRSLAGSTIVAGRWWTWVYCIQKYNNIVILEFYLWWTSIKILKTCFHKIINCVYLVVQRAIVISTVTKKEGWLWIYTTSILTAISRKSWWASTLVSSIAIPLAGSTIGAGRWWTWVFSQRRK